VIYVGFGSGIITGILGQVEIPNPVDYVQTRVSDLDAQTRVSGSDFATLNTRRQAGDVGVYK